MRHLIKSTGRQYEKGAIAVEAAIILPILLLFLGLPSIFLAFYCRQYTAAQKAVHDVGLYLSTAPRIEMITAGSDGAPAAVTVAKTILEKEMTGIVPSGTSLNPEFVCLYRIAASPVMKLCTTVNNQDPAQTLIQIGVSMRVSYVDPLTGSETGISISPYAPVPYVGN